MVRAIGPVCASVVVADTGHTGTRPNWPLMPASPVKQHGMRIEPPPSVPSASGTIPEASAAELPPLEPPAVRHILDQAAKQFLTLGCVVEHVEQVFETDPVEIWAAEFYAGAGARLRPFLESQRELIDPAIADILDVALRQDLRSYYANVFARYALRDKMRLFFENYDLLLSPVLPVTSLDVGKNVPDHHRHRDLVSWVYYPYPFNLTGQPAATVCAGIAADGMPVGLQLVGDALGEFDVVRAAAAYERSQPKGYNVKAFTP